MAYTTPRTWNAEAVTAAKWNVEIRDNQRAIKDPPSQNYESNEGSDYTTTSPNYANVDNDFSFSLTTTGGDVLVCFVGAGVSSGSRGANIAILVDGVTTILSALIPNTTESALPQAIQFARLVTGLSAGVHTFALQWRVAGGGTNLNTMYAGAGTANYDIHPQFWAREIS